MAPRASQGLIKTLYCRAAQDVSTQVQFLQVSTDLEDGEENPPAGLCGRDPAQPAEGERGRRAAVCVCRVGGAGRAAASLTAPEHRR